METWENHGLYLSICIIYRCFWNIRKLFWGNPEKSGTSLGKKEIGWPSQVMTCHDLTPGRWITRIQPDVWENLACF
jgi:hypothetical protein